MILKMAWKNIFRYKRRTLITASAIAFGVFFTILFDGLLFGMDNESLQNLLDFETSGAKFFAAGYFDEREKYPLDYVIEKDDAEKIFSQIDSQKRSGVPEVVTSCEVYFNEDYFETSGSISSILCAVDVEKSKEVFKHYKHIQSGTWLERKDGEFCDGVVIGSWIAQDMNAQVGYYVTIQCKGRDGFMQTMDAPIVGIINSPDSKVNMSCIYMDIDYIDEMLSMEGAVTDIAVNLGSRASVNKNYSKFKKAVSLPQNIELYSWDVIEAELVALQGMYSSISTILMLFLFFVAAIGVSNTMLMSVLERKNEIAMLKSMGYTPFYIRRLFMYEGVFIGVVGCIIGAAIGGLVNIPLVNHGLDFTNLLADVDLGYRITGVLRSGWNFASYVKILLGALIISALASYIPAHSTSNKEIAEIFRKV